MAIYSILSAALALAAPVAAPEWAPIAITEGDSPTLYFVDRTSIAATPDGSRAFAYLATAGGGLRLHVEYGCRDARYRFLDSALPADAPAGAPAATRWIPINPDTPLHHTMRYVCSGGKADFGFGDLAVKSASPEAFAREFLARRAKRK